MEAVNCHRHDVDHEMTEEVEALERLLSARKLENLKTMVRGEATVGVLNRTSTNSQVESCTSGWKRWMCVGT